MSATTSEVRWVYIYLDTDDVPLYVGCTVNVDQRHENHRSTAPWFEDAVDVRSMGPFPRALAFRIETALIKALQPPGNTLHTDRDPRRPGNWAINLPPAPYRVMVRRGGATHFGHQWGQGGDARSECGLIEGRMTDLHDSDEPPTCRACLRSVSMMRTGQHLPHGLTWMQAFETGVVGVA